MPDSSSQTDLTDLIVAEANQPRRSESDGQMAEARDLRELVAAKKTIDAAKAAAKGSAWGRIKMARAVPPGADPR